MLPTAIASDERRALRTTLGQFATGVAIVTARGADGRHVGVTINSFASVSLDPPLVLWSLRATAASRPVIAAAGHHTINVLAAAQEGLARRFAAPGADRFAGVALRLGPFGALLVEGALAQLVGRVLDRREIGDHTLFVCEVVHHRSAPGEPLIFHAGHYRGIGEPAGTGGLKQTIQTRPETEIHALHPHRILHAGPSPSLAPTSDSDEPPCPT